ncbi:hypothetical protein ES708_29484 [subsurface metagenome]
MYVVRKAGSGVGAGDGFRARAEGEYLLYYLQGLTHGPGAGKGSKVTPPVFFKTSGSVNSGPVFIEVYLEIGEGLVIFQTNIIPGVMSLYQV